MKERYRRAHRYGMSQQETVGLETLAHICGLRTEGRRLGCAVQRARRAQAPRSELEHLVDGWFHPEKYGTSGPIP